MKFVLIILSCIVLSSSSFADSAEEKRLEKQENIRSLFTVENLMKILFSDQQDRLVTEYLENFDDTTEDDLIENLSSKIDGTFMAIILEPYGVGIRLYARAHKDEELLMSLVGMFKDRSNFYSFLGVSAFLFILGYMKKKYKKKNKGNPGAIVKNLIISVVLLCLHYFSIMFFFGENIQPTINAYKEIQRQLNNEDSI